MALVFLNYEFRIMQFGASAEWKQVICSFDLSLQNYFKQKVISKTVQSDGTYYTGKLQQDTIATIKFSRDFAAEILSVLPEIRYGMRGSNQNYQHFENVMSTTSVGYYSDYYSYSQIGFALPIVLAVSKKWETFFKLRL